MVEEHGKKKMMEEPRTTDDKLVEQNEKILLRKGKVEDAQKCLSWLLNEAKDEKYQSELNHIKQPIKID